jgi:hypothetical protein
MSDRVIEVEKVIKKYKNQTCPGYYFGNHHKFSVKNTMELKLNKFIKGIGLIRYILT